jgi:hypothetical protein
MLNFSEFQDYALMTIPERLPEEYKGAQIRSHEVEKNNGLVLHGITVTPEDSNIAPNVYLDGYFKQYEEGKDLGCYHGSDHSYSGIQYQSTGRVRQYR